MKKILIILAIIIVILTFKQTNDEYIVIPKDSIRFRIIPNSNIIEDIFMKEKVKESINETINNIQESTDIDESRENIVKSIPLIKTNINELFEDYNYNKNIEIKYGLNYFPEKIYNGIKYEEGNYESLVIKIGEAKGDNYWCVLFPPLCLMEAEENEEVEYKFFVKEIINKFIKE